MFGGPTGGGKVGGELRRGEEQLGTDTKKTPLIPSEFPSGSVCR